MGGSKVVCVNYEVGNVVFDLCCEGFIKGFGGDVIVLLIFNDLVEIEVKVVVVLFFDEDVDIVMVFGVSIVGELIVVVVKVFGCDVNVVFFDLFVNFL